MHQLQQHHRELADLLNRIAADGVAINVGMDGKTRLIQLTDGRHSLVLRIEPQQVTQPAKPAPQQVDRSPCYTGDICPDCKGSRMVRAGACSKCLDCGGSGGCG